MRWFQRPFIIHRRSSIRRLKSLRLSILFPDTILILFNYERFLVENCIPTYTRHNGERAVNFLSCLGLTLSKTNLEIKRAQNAWIAHEDCSALWLKRIIIDVIHCLLQCNLSLYSDEKCKECRVKRVLEIWRCPPFYSYTGEWYNDRFWK